MVFSGSVFLFFMTQLFYIPSVGILSILFGWTAANPGVASSRMILFIPGGFIFGGQSGPMSDLVEWVRLGSHCFPLVWEYKFVRDIMMRGAGFWDIAGEFGRFLLYIGILLVIFLVVFYKARKNLQARDLHKDSI
jgi:ABC-2 type transport system permease protein